VINVSTLSKLRRLVLRDNVSIREASRQLGISRNTAKKWLEQSEMVEPRYPKRASGPGILGPYEEVLTQWLKSDSHRNKRERRGTKALFEGLRALGYPGSRGPVYTFALRWRKEQDLAAKGQGYVPMHFDMGEAFQFDWSTEYAVIGGLRRRLDLAHTKLAASRAFVLSAYYNQAHEMLFEAHARAFAVFGGVTKRGIYDNMKTAVDKVGVGKRRIVNTRFAAMASHYLFDPDFCNVASGWEKGVVEKNVQDSRRRIWQAAGTLRFGSFAELNVWLEKRCRELWAELPYPDVEHLTIADALTMEQDALMPMVPEFDGYVETTATVSSTSLVSIERNKYSVPCALANQKVSVRLYPERIEVHDDTGKVASHERSFDRGEVRYDWRHYIPLIERKPGALRNGAPFDGLPEPLQKLRATLIKRPGGDRVMADVLAGVLTYGLEAVLVAAELLLESGNPSQEHVKNVLARLAEPPPPANLETAHTVTEAPVANAGRYNHLLAEVDHA
jgi:transposase